MGANEDQSVDNYAVKLFCKRQSVAEAEQERHSIALWRRPFVVVADDQRVRKVMGKTFTYSCQSINHIKIVMGNLQIFTYSHTINTSRQQRQHYTHICDFFPDFPHSTF